MKKRSYKKITKENYKEWLVRRKKKDTIKEFGLWFEAYNKEKQIKDVIISQIYYIKTRIENLELAHNNSMLVLSGAIGEISEQQCEFHEELSYIHEALDDLYYRQDELTEVQACND